MWPRFSDSRRRRVACVHHVDQDRNPTYEYPKTTPSFTNNPSSSHAHTDNEDIKNPVCVTFSKGQTHARSEIRKRQEETCICIEIFGRLPAESLQLRVRWILRRNNRLLRCSLARCRRAPSSWRAPAAAAASPSSTHVVWPSVWTGASTLRTPAITESAWWRTACSMCLRARAPAAVPMAPALRRCSRTRAAWRSAQRATSSSR